MREYICHKRVKAAQIVDVNVASNPPGSMLTLDTKESVYSPMLVGTTLCPVVGDYIVEDEHGRKQIVSAVSFEKDYSLAAFSDPADEASFG